MRVEPRILLVLAGAFLVPACGGGGGSSPQAPDAGAAVGIATINGPEANETGLGGGRLPLVRIISPTSGSSCHEGATITIQAVAVDPDAAIARVDFYDGSVLLGSRLVAPFNLAWGGVKAGAHVLTAVAFDITGAAGSSLPVTIFATARGDENEDQDDEIRRGRSNRK
jgi:Bacterial Ig domain